MGREIAQPDRFRQHNRAPENGKRRELFDLQMIQPGEMGNVVGYLSKEMTPWAQRAMNYALPRRPGAHKLTVGGDRVRMCMAVEKALERADLIKPHRKAYAKASLTRRCQPSCVTKRHIASPIVTSTETIEQGDEHERRELPWTGDERNGGEPMVAMRRIVENIGLAWNSQYVKLLQQKTKFSCYDIITRDLRGNAVSMVCMPVAKLPLWLASINPNKIIDAYKREKIERYQAESAIALHDYWTKGIARRAPAATPPAPRVTTTIKLSATSRSMTIHSKRCDRGGMSAMIEQGHEVAGRRQSERRQPRGHPGKVRRRACVLRSSCRRHANRPAARLRLS